MGDQSSFRFGWAWPFVSTISAPANTPFPCGPRLMDGLSGLCGVCLPATPSPVRLVDDAISSSGSSNSLSGMAGTPLRVATPRGLRPEVIISLWTRRGGGGVRPRPAGWPLPIDGGINDGVDPDPEPVADVDPDGAGSSPPHGKYGVGRLTGVCSGEPRTGVRGAMSPSSSDPPRRRRPPSRGSRLTTGVRMDLTSEVEVRDV